MSSISNSGPASYTGDNCGAVLPADYLIVTEDGVGRIGRLPGALPGASYRRPAGAYIGAEGVESQGPIIAPSMIVTNFEASFLQADIGIRLANFSLVTVLPYTMTFAGSLFLVDATAGAGAFNLIRILATASPSTTSSGLYICVVKVDSSANTVTVTPNAADQIEFDSVGPQVLAAQGDRFLAQAIQYPSAAAGTWQM